MEATTAVACINLVGLRYWTCFLTAVLLYVGLSANSRGQETGEFKILLHLSYRGFSGSDSSWAMCMPEYLCQQGLSLGG